MPDYVVEFFKSANMVMSNPDHPSRVRGDGNTITINAASKADAYLKFIEKFKNENEVFTVSKGETGSPLDFTDEELSELKNHGISLSEETNQPNHIQINSIELLQG